MLCCCAASRSMFALSDETDDGEGKAAGSDAIGQRHDDVDEREEREGKEREYDVEKKTKRCDTVRYVFQK